MKTISHQFLSPGQTGKAHATAAVSTASRKKYFFSTNCLAIAAVAALASTSASAALITELYTDNLGISTGSPNTAGVTIIYDRNLPDSSARSSGQIVFDGSESNTPGLKIVNDAAPGVPASNGDVFNAIMANSIAMPNSPKQSGKRLKFQRTAHEATDLVFKLDPNGQFATDDNDGLYKVSWPMLTPLTPG